MRRTNGFGAALAVLALALAACGGSSTGGAPPVVIEAPKAKAPPPSEGPAKKAALRFAGVERRLDDMKDGKPVNIGWLRGELEAVLSIDPNHAAARFNLAVILEKAGDTAKARTIYEQLMREDSSFVPAAENVAALQVQAGNVGYAVSVYEAAIKADPKNLTSRLGLARIRQREGKHKEAIALSRKVLQRKADAIEAFRILAESYQAVGDTSMAELIIGRGLKVEEKDVHLHYLTARILLDRGDLAGGVDKLKQVIGMKPDWLKVRAELANIALKYQDFGNAAQQLEAIIKKAPKDRAARIGLAVAYKGQGRHDQARKIYEELLNENPSDLEAMWNLAVLKYRHLDDFDGAINDFKKFKGNAPANDAGAKKVDKVIAKVTRIKKDVASRREKEERERKKKEAIDSACAAVAKGKKPNAEAIGNEQERIQSAWDIMLVQAVPMIQAGDVAGGTNLANCALKIVPRTAGTGATVCAQMHVQWVQMQDQLGLLASSSDLKKALRTVQEAVACDPENPDAVLFEQQLKEWITQTEAAEQAAPPEGMGGDGMDGAGAEPAGP